MKDLDLHNFVIEFDEWDDPDGHFIEVIPAINGFKGKDISAVYKGTNHNGGLPPYWHGWATLERNGIKTYKKGDVIVYAGQLYAHPSPGCCNDVYGRAKITKELPYEIMEDDKIIKNLYLEFVGLDVYYFSKNRHNKPPDRVELNLLDLPGLG